MMAMTEREAEVFFAKINRPMPRSPQYIREVGVKAIEDAIINQRRIDAAATKAVRNALKFGSSSSGRPPNEALPH